MALELKDLTPDETLGLVALIERAVGADGRVTDPEAAAVRAVVSAVGRKAYGDAASKLDEHFEDEEALRKFLAKIGRPEARELIYATVLETALVDTVGEGEAELLDWLAKTWDVETRIEK